MSDLAGYLNISHSNSYYFTNACNNDILIYPETSNQVLHFGITSNSQSLIAINSNTTTINSSNLNINGAISLSNTLNVSSNATFSNGLTVYNRGTTMLSNAVNIYGATTLSNTLTTTGGITTLSNAVNIYGATTLSNTLTTTGDIRTSASIYADAGHFIATISPMCLDTNTSGSIYLRSCKTNGNIGEFSNIATFSTNSHTFYTNTNVALQINSSGNVGIGTTSPAYALDVAGTINCTAVYSPYFQRVNANATYNVGSYVDSTILQIGYTSYTVNGDGAKYLTAGSICLKAQNLTWAIGETIAPKGAEIYLEGGRSAMGSQDHGSIYFRTGGSTYTTGTTRMTVAGNSGNVGIGTPSPAYKLDLTSNCRISSGSNTQLMRFSDSNDGVGVSDLQILNASYSSGGGVGWGAKVIGININSTMSGTNVPTKYSQNGGLTYASAISLSTDSGGSGSAPLIGFWTSGGAVGANLACSMSINTTGNVGIGTTSPAYALDVRLNSTNGGAIASFLNPIMNNTNSSILFGSNISNYACGFINYTNNNSPSINLGLYGSTNYVTINSNGVGIGMTTPAYSLDVNGAVRFGNSGAGYAYLNYNAGSTKPANMFSGAIAFNAAGSGGGMDFVDCWDTAPANKLSAFNFWSLSNNTLVNRLNIANNGNVGIGTTTPTGKLSVEGNYATGTFLQITKSGVVSWGSAALYDATRYINCTGNAENTKDFNVGPGGVGIGYSPPLYAKAGRDGLYVNGYVGIGTDSPAYKLEVVGNANINEWTFSNNILTSAGRGSYGWSALQIVPGSYATNQNGAYWGVGSSIISYNPYGPNNLNTTYYTGWNTTDVGGNNSNNSAFTYQPLYLVSQYTQNHGPLYVGYSIKTQQPSGYTLDVAGNTRITGTVQLGANAVNNKLLVLYDQDVNESISTGSNFYGFGINLSTLRYQVPNGTSHKWYNGSTNTMTLNSSGNISVTGSITKASGTFDIQHPLYTDSNKRLVHSFLEGPRCDLIYRGTVALSNGQAIVNIDSECVANPECAMDQGTFVALCANPVKYLHNNSSFDPVKGSISGNLLTIICANSNSSDEIDWMVVAERKDSHIKKWERTNENGYLITQYTTD